MTIRNLLKKIAKGISIEQVLQTIWTCKEIGIRSKVFFTFGHFGETFKECREDVRFIEKNKSSIDFFMFRFLWQAVMPKIP
jgi:radical SAM superfamily enzyme YgiQ (UPF0313 family)